MWGRFKKYIYLSQQGRIRCEFIVLQKFFATFERSLIFDVYYKKRMKKW